jgi:hypothetical protein
MVERIGNYMNHPKAGFLKCGLLIGVCIFGSLPAYADLIVSIQSVAANPGSSGNTFDVLLADNGSPGVSVAGFNFDIQTADPDITFTGVFTSTASALYIFAGNSLLGPEIDDQLSPTLTAADFAISGSATLNSGDVVGLGQVTFAVSPTATPGPFTVSFVTSGGTADNSFSDPNGNNVPIDSFTSGTITVAPGASNGTPEPSSFLLMLTGTAALAGLLRRRRA